MSHHRTLGIASSVASLFHVSSVHIDKRAVCPQPLLELLRFQPVLCRVAFVKLKLKPLLLRRRLVYILPVESIYLLDDIRSHPPIFIAGDEFLLPLVLGLDFAEGLEDPESHLEELLELLSVEYLLLLLLLVVDPAVIALVIGHWDLVSHITLRRL